ncbi:MAG: GntR family transcriptional regulator, partial [Clostridium baratii]|nr:GntR family transcriptional regulator [Clostridium baratii]
MNKYLEISSTLLKRIEIGFYDNTSNPIPNEIELAKEFNCSRMTLRKAIDIL